MDLPIAIDKLHAICGKYDFHGEAKVDALVSIVVAEFSSLLERLVRYDIHLA